MDVDYFINNDNIFSTMLYLSYYDLMTICWVNTIIRQISNNDKFWQTKITLDYDYPTTYTWKNLETNVQVFYTNIQIKCIRKLHNSRRY